MERMKSITTADVDSIIDRIRGCYVRGWDYSKDITRLMSIYNLESIEEAYKLLDIEPIEHPAKGKEHHARILCGIEDKNRIINELRKHDIKHEKTFYLDEEIYIDIVYTDEQTEEVDSIPSLRADDQAVMKCLDDFSDSSVDKKNLIVEDAGRIKEYQSYGEMIEVIRCRLQQYEDDNLIFRKLNSDGTISYKSYAEINEKIKCSIDKYWY